MTVYELRKALENFGPGRQVLVGIDMAGCRPVGDITLCEHDEKVVINGIHIPATDIRFPG
jgi:hypothetical protein